MPLQVSPTGKSAVTFSKPLAVAAYIDSAKILGLPKFKLRDSSGNLYIYNKSLLEESLASINDHAGYGIPDKPNQRKAYIQSYVRR